MKKLTLLLTVFALSLIVSAQTPGLIVNDAGTGAGILDPDGDGYVSQKTAGTQIGFTNPPNSDVSQSEIPYVPIVTYDPIDDLEQGRYCFFSELVGGANPDQFAALMYWDAAHSAMLYRIRICDYIENSKGYSILIDTDQKFGFTGPNADPNALPGNPGFEIELSMMTNHGVAIYDVDGTLNPIEIDLKPYDNYCQKSVAISTYCDNPDYFIDFYLPIADLSSFGVDENTPMRFAIITNMNPDPVIGSNSLSDVGGDCGGNTLDEKVICVIEGQTPTAPTDVNDGILSRSICPPINNVFVSSANITGTTTEVNGTTIEVFVYQSDGTTLIGSGTTLSSGGAWTIAVSSLSPSVTLAEGQIVKATATAPGKGTSDDGCDQEVVDECEVLTDPPTDGEINIIPGDKGYRITIDRPVGTKVYLYNSDGTLFDIGLLKSGATNPYITTTQPETFDFECQTGQCFERAQGSSVYRFVFQEPGICDSYEYLSCDYTTATSAVPTITTNPITVNTTTISGTGNSTNAEIMLYINDIIEDAVIISGGSPYNYSFTVSGLQLGDKIDVIQIESTKCYSAPATKYVTRQAYYPNLIGPDCNPTYPITSIIGTSVEAAGTTITVYKLNPSRSSLGTTTVQADGTWTKTGLSLNAGDQITAAVTAGTYLTPSIDGDTITLATQTSISAYTISINAITEGQTSVSGTISGGTYPNTLTVYADSSAIGSGVVNAAGNWTVSGIPSYDIATGSTINVRITETGKCESLESSAEVIVQCNYPAAVTITSSTSYFCDGAYGYITVQNSQAGVYYEPVLANDSSTFGYGRMGNGGDLLLTTYQITDTVSVSVKGSKFPIGLCINFVATNIEFTPGLRPVPPLASPVQYFCTSGTLADLDVNVPAGTSIKWYNAPTGGSELPTSTPLVDGVNYYVEAICDTNNCTSNNRTMIDVEQGNPPPPEASANQTTCIESTLEDINADPNGPGTVVWYSSASGGTPLPIDTPLQNGMTYYAEVVYQTCSSTTRTAITITLGMVTDTTQWTGAVSNEWTDDANWTDQHPTVCTHVIIPDPGNGIEYPVISAPAACKSITFLPGGGVLGLHKLTYERAYVQLQTRREIWYTLTAPLKEMYSGDYYFTGKPEAYMKLFDAPSPDEIGPNITYAGTFTRSFKSLKEPLTPGLSYAFYVSPKTWDYPNGFTNEYDDTLLKFPQTNPDGSLLTSYVPYSAYNGMPYPFITQTVTKDDFLAYRFAMEDTNNVLPSIINIPIKAGLNFIGNPMMCHLDFNALYPSNVGVISNKVKFWNGTTFTTYMWGSEIYSSLDLSSTSIAPMQAFFVEGLGEGLLTVDLDNHYFIDLTTKLRSSSTPSNVLHIKAENGAKRSSTAIALRTNASNAYGDDDAFKMFSQYTDVPEVYSVADEMALDINQFSNLPYMTPIGLKTSAQGPITMTFDGIESFDTVNITLMNTRTGDQQNLKANNQYVLNYDGTETDGYLFVEFRNANTTTDTPEAESCEGNRCIQVYQKSKDEIGIISPASDKIQNISIWEKSGLLLYSKYNVNKSMIDAKIVAPNQTCIVRVTTENKTYVIKLIMKQ